MNEIETYDLDFYENKLSSRVERETSSEGHMPLNGSLFGKPRILQKQLRISKPQQYLAPCRTSLIELDNEA